MSDDLVKRINVLSADKINLRSENMELKAKLAKAVVALKDIVKDCDADYPPSHGAIKHFANTTLAGLKGTNQ